MSCSPCVAHWHLRKCAGTDIQRAFTLPGGGRSPRYVEVHGDFRQFARELRRVRRRCCAVRTVVVLRDPYEQLISEMDFFPGDFSPATAARPLSGRLWTTPHFQTREDHLVCRHNALMGLCRERCNATRVVRRLRDFDHVGLVGETMGCTFATLARWVMEGGASDPADAGVAGALQRRARRPEMRARNASARIARYHEIVSDLPSPPPPPPPGAHNALRVPARRRRPPRQGTRQHLALLTHLPSRAEFDAHNACSNQVVALARSLLVASCRQPPTTEAAPR